jgi:hypothetical protein
MRTKAVDGGRKRRHGDVDRVEPVEQILPKPAGRDLVMEIAVGGRNHLHIDLDGPRRPHGHDLPQFENPQEFGLQVEREFADLVFRP